MWDLSYYDFVQLYYVSQMHITSHTFEKGYEVASNWYSIS